jgi:hypothetical protein
MARAQICPCYRNTSQVSVQVGCRPKVPVEFSPIGLGRGTARENSGPGFDTSKKACSAVAPRKLSSKVQKSRGLVPGNGDTFFNGLDLVGC